jgi:hypothetical protein
MNNVTLVVENNKCFIEHETSKSKLYFAFNSIDSACDFLVDSLHIEDTEVDNALITMSVLDKNIVLFKNGVVSDDY